MGDARDDHSAPGPTGDAAPEALRLDPHAILESIPEPFGLIDRSGRIIAFNAAGRRVVQLAREQPLALGDDLFSLISPHNQAGVRESLRRSFAGEAHTHATEARGHHFETVYSPVRGPDGAVAAVAIRVADVTARETALAELAALNASLERRVSERTEEIRAILSSTYDGFALLRVGGGFVDVNGSYCRMVGYGREELLGMRLRDLDVGLSPEAFEATGRELFESGSVSFETRHRRKDGRVVDLEATVNWIDRSEGLYFAFLRDVTARKEAEAEREERAAELARLNADLERAARAKDSFLASMSHELRTPLTGILGATELLRTGVHGPLTERQKRSLGYVEEAGRHLLALLSDILDLAKIGAERLSLASDACSLGEVCESALSMVRSEARRKGIDLSLTMPPAPVRFVADGRRLRQVLVNLLSNAVKFTPGGGRVVLGAEAEAEKGELRFEVRDTGPGIAPEDLPRLFKPFTQLDTRLSREHAGTGLGLALVRSLTEAHGGRVEAESEPGRGSLFRVVLPWRLPAGRGSGEHRVLASAPPPGAEPAPAAPPRVLLVEDDDANRTILAEYLAVRGFEVEEASNGLEALTLAEASDHDVVVLDIQLPGMDGLEVLARLGSLSRRRPPVLALTALAMAGDRDRILEAGADAYLAKPAPLAQLGREIDRLLAAGSPPAGGSPDRGERT